MFLNLFVNLCQFIQQCGINTRICNDNAPDLLLADCDILSLVLYTDIFFIAENCITAKFLANCLNRRKRLVRIDFIKQQFLNKK